MIGDWEANHASRMTCAIERVGPHPRQSGRFGDRLTSALEILTAYLSCPCNVKHVDSRAYRLASLVADTHILRKYLPVRTCCAQSEGHFVVFFTQRNGSVIRSSEL